MDLWSYQGQPVLDEVNRIGGDVAEAFYARLYEVLQRPLGPARDADQEPAGRVHSAL